MISNKAKDLVQELTFRVGGDALEWMKAHNALLVYIEQLEKQVSDARWEASARHAQATGGTM